MPETSHFTSGVASNVSKTDNQNASAILKLEARAPAPGLTVRTNLEMGMKANDDSPKNLEHHSALTTPS